jgi:hypothetical protein
MCYMGVPNQIHGDPPLAVSLRGIASLSIVAGCIEVTRYLDVDGVYPGIMTDNTVQFGLTLAKAYWEPSAGDPPDSRPLPSRPSGLAIVEADRADTLTPASAPSRPVPQNSAAGA